MGLFMEFAQIKLSRSEVSRLAVMCHFELCDRLVRDDLHTDYDIEQNNEAIAELREIERKLSYAEFFEGGETGES